MEPEKLAQMGDLAPSSSSSSSSSSVVIGAAAWAATICLRRRNGFPRERRRGQAACCRGRIRKGRNESVFFPARTPGSARNRVIKHRLTTMERIVTDASYRTDREIDGLRGPAK